MTGPIRVAWFQKSRATGTLGFPTAEPDRTAEGLLRGDFQGSWITYDPASGAVVVVEGGR